MTRIGSLARLAIVASVCQPVLASSRTLTELIVHEPTFSPENCDEAGITARQCTSTYSNFPFTVQHTTIPTGVTPLSAKTQTKTFWDLELVTLYLPPGAVPRSELVDYQMAPAPAELLPRFVVDMTLTAPASCPTLFEYTTTIDLRFIGDGLPKSFISSELLPKGTVEAQTFTETRTLLSPILGGTPRTTVTQTLVAAFTTIHIKPTDLPPIRPAALAEDDYPYYPHLGFVSSYYIQNCYLPGQERPLTKEETCPYTYAGACSHTEPWVVIVAAVIPSVFLLGFVENFFWFRRLMLGKWCLRFGTVCWSLLLIFVVSCTLRERDRDAEDQARLKEQWKAIPFWMKMKLWFRWGFRHQYPVAWLGEKKKTVSGEESIEMGRGGGASGGAGSAGQGGEDDMPLPAYPGPPSSRVSDVHSVNSGSAVATPGPVLGNPNAVLASTGPVLGSGTVVIGPTMTPAQPQSPASTQRPEADQRPPGDGLRAV
ncbi:hypothetical protein QBC40DRAFT_291449 [Triangularia verruculosa]|uniref:Uncharacterized protein n=1 Tax=Triangularia verruculosa TaxID=2587418 RepID=A0AAN6X5L1_9PEZI|nr:hypothetical protein QBC40DRAFT_291449 [Triangularia verruculosa]